MIRGGELAHRLLTSVTEKWGMAVVIMSSVHWIVMRRVQTILGVSKGQHVWQAER